jgi:hypothetical protein
MRPRRAADRDLDFFGIKQHAPARPQPKHRQDAVAGQLPHAPR